MSSADLLRLRRVVEDEAALLKEFITLLDQEEKLLVGGETDALLTTAEQKTQIYRRLQFLHDERSRITARAGQSNFATLLASDPATASRWNEVLALAADAQRRNGINGQLINERMKHNQAALSVLLAAANQPQLYGPDGQSRPTSRGRPLGSV